MEHTGVMDLSFNTAFNTNADIKGTFGFDLSGSLLNTSVQLGSLNTVNSVVLPNQFKYCNKDTFTFSDVSFNTHLTNSNSHIVNVSNDIGVTNPGSWNIKLGTFSNPNTLEAYPQHVYDISGYYFMNNKFPDSTGPYFKAFAQTNAYSLLNKETGYANKEETSYNVFGNENYLKSWSGNVDYSNVNEVPEYQIRLTHPPPNYPSASSNDTTKLANVRDVSGNQHYAIMIDSSGSILDISFNIASDYPSSPGTYGSVTNFADASVTNFITCAHDASLNDVGNNIFNGGPSTIPVSFLYSLDLEHPGNQNQLPIVVNTVQTDFLYPWYGNIQGTSVQYPHTVEKTNSNPFVPGSKDCINITVVSDDAVGPVINNASILQQKYGGYYYCLLYTSPSPRD